MKIPDEMKRRMPLIFLDGELWLFYFYFVEIYLLNSLLPVLIDVSGLEGNLSRKEFHFQPIHIGIGSDSLHLTIHRTRSKEFHMRIGLNC
jgi:hypothetical protein